MRPIYCVTLSDGFIAKQNLTICAAAKPKEGRVYGGNTQRLSKALAKMGVASRRKAEELIFDGKVEVNGEVATLPQTPVHISNDKIVVNGEKMQSPKNSTNFYFVLNKPKGYLCTSKAESSDGKRKKIVLDLFQDWLEKWKKQNPQIVLPPRLFTVGRLDRNSWGLLFVTNDGKWAQKVAHPSSGLTKEYVVHVEPSVTAREIKSISEGVEIDGKLVHPVAITLENGYLRVVVAEGKNREVRRMVEKSGLLVSSLKRVRIGGFRLPSDLKVGEFRKLKTQERRRVTNLGAQNVV